MKRFPPHSILYIWMALSLGACGDDDPASPPAENPNRVEATIGSDGGALVSSDGVFSLEIRPLAFDAPTLVSIETLVTKNPAYRIASENPSPAVGVLVRWDLGALATPENDRYRHPFTRLRVSSEEPTPDPAAQRLRLDGESDRIELSGEILHLDLDVSYEEEALVVGMGPVAPSGLAGTLFELEAEIEQSANSIVGAQPGFQDRLDLLNPPQALVLVELATDALPVIEAGIASSTRQGVASYRWTSAPSGRFWAELHLDELVLDQMAMDYDWTLELFLPVRGEEINPGGEVFPSRTAFPTGLIVPRLPWGPFTEGLVVGVVGSDGVPFLDAETGFLLNGDLQGLESLLGGVAMSNVGDVATSSGQGPPSYLLEALFLYGSGGAGLSSWAWGMGEFGPPMKIEDGAEVVDAAPYGGDPRSGGVCYAMPTLNEVGFVEPNLAGDRFERSELRIDVSKFPNAPGPVVSAYRRNFDGEVLVVCDGAPGALYLWDPTDDSAVTLGSVGDDPAQIRGMGEVAVVSNFASETLTTIHWPWNGSPVIRATLSAPGGPRGIDLWPVETEFELVASGFSTDQLHVYLLNANGVVLTSENQDLPLGCVGPSAAAHLILEERVVAGFTSSTLARISGLEDGP